MKMRPGPKAILIFILAVGLVGFGFWAGRGFPRTWEAAFRTQAVAPVAHAVDVSRVNELESRVTALEGEVATLKDAVRSARQVAPPVEPRPLSSEPQSEGPSLPTPSSAPRDSSADTGVEYR
ncbi:MAG TPA: hypothetical protein VGM51_03400 [Armatimonadota bacterium]|jgi:hypothetical protein